MPVTLSQTQIRKLNETNLRNSPTTPRTRKRMIDSETNILDLPPDVLLQILTRLDQHHLVRLSLVSKSFKTLTDGLIRTLSFKRLLSASFFRRLLSRFPSVTRIHLNTASIVRPLTAIANSTLKIETLGIYQKPSSFPSREQRVNLSRRFGDVKALTIRWSGFVTGLHLADFILMFESLEELNLDGYAFYPPWSDLEIAGMAPEVRNLRKISLNTNLTDRSLDALSNCANLEDVSLEGCRWMTIQGLCAFVRKSKNLKSIEVPCGLQDFQLTVAEGDILALAEAISRCENLSHLAIIEGLVTDVFLSVIANSRSPLTSLVYRESGVPQLSYTMTGLSAMLRAFQGLTKLHVCLPLTGLHTQDIEMSQLVESLVHLKDVWLVSHTTAYATIFSLIHNCQVLKSISIDYWSNTNTQCDVNVPRLIRKN